MVGEPRQNNGLVDRDEVLSTMSSLGLAEMAESERKKLSPVDASLGMKIAQEVMVILDNLQLGMASESLYVQIDGNGKISVYGLMNNNRGEDPLLIDKLRASFGIDQLQRAVMGDTLMIEFYLADYIQVKRKEGGFEGNVVAEEWQGGPQVVGKKIGVDAMSALINEEIDSTESVAGGLVLSIDAMRKDLTAREFKLYAAIDIWFKQKFGEPEDGGNWKLGDIDEDGREKRNMKIEGANLVVSFPVMNQSAVDSDGRLDLGYLVSVNRANYRTGKGGKLEVLIPLAELDKLINQ